MLSENFIEQFCSNAASVFANVSKEGINPAWSIDIDCDILEDYTGTNIEKADQYKNWFAELKKISGPVLYWFQIKSDIDSAAIVDAFNVYKDDPSRKNIPALRNRPYMSSRVLYVGKVEKGIGGRLIQHLGYKGRKTQGLQLFHWTKGLGLKLELVVLSFPKEMTLFMSIVERAVATELKPLIGKHK